MDDELRISRSSVGLAQKDGVMSDEQVRVFVRSDKLLEEDLDVEVDDPVEVEVVDEHFGEDDVSPSDY